MHDNKNVQNDYITIKYMYIYARVYLEQKNVLS